jgi:hypothetical protein
MIELASIFLSLWYFADHGFTLVRAKSSDSMQERRSRIEADHYISMKDQMVDAICIS